MKDDRPSVGERVKRSGRRLFLVALLALPVAVAGDWVLAENRGYSVKLLPTSEWGFGVEYSWTSSYYTPFSSTAQEVGRKYGFVAITRR